MPIAEIPWTQDRVEMLAALWAEGLPCSAIGARMKVSRCAVIGKVNREGLPKRPKAVSQANNLNGRHKPRPHVAKPPGKPRPPSLSAAAIVRRGALPRVAVPDVGPLPGSQPRPWLTRAFGECAWPVSGEGAETLSCCEPAGCRTYCAAHMAIRNQPAPVRRKAA